jgi:hypothetical protein
MPESRPGSEPGLDSAVSLAGLIRSPPRHPWVSTPPLVDLFVTEESSLWISGDRVTDSSNNVPKKPEHYVSVFSGEVQGYG